MKYDYEKIIGLAKERRKLIEINNHSFFVRKSSIENCRKIAEICKRMGTGIVVSSDAHFHAYIGRYDMALQMLAGIDFPEKLIINRSLKAYEDYVSPRKKLFGWKMGE